MAGKWVDILADKPFKGYLSLPDSGFGPGLILFSEIFGVNNHIRRMADKFADEGYVVLAPDMFWRASPGYEAGYRGSDFKQGLELIKQINPDDFIDDLSLILAKFKTLPYLTKGIGAIGYCMGGYFAYRLAAVTSEIDIVISYYGGQIENNLNEALKIKGKVVLHYAEFDDYIDSQSVTKIRNAFSHRTDVQIYTYKGSHHGFNCDERKTYDPICAELAYARSLDALRLNIGPFQDLNETWQNFESKAFSSNQLNEISDLVSTDAYINFWPSLAQAFGNQAVVEFFDQFKETKLPEDFKVKLVSRTISANRIIDEIIISFTHSRLIPFLIPNISPTLKFVKIPAIVIAEFRGNKMHFERIYFDAVSILVQIGLLDSSILPVINYNDINNLEAMISLKN